METESKITPLDIAMDVIKHLDSKLIRAEAGTYFFNEDTEALADDNVSLQPFLQAGGRACHVCALGAMFISVVYAENKATVLDAYESDRIKRVLSPYISEQQLKLIEHAFECRCLRLHKEESVQVAMIFGQRYWDDDKRLRAIMQNMIDNGGEFRPSVEAK